MKIKNIISAAVALLCLSISAVAYCEDGLSYDDTVNLIAKTMTGSTSDARKESYEYVRFDKCVMNYNVLGTYPVGDLYNIKFTGIDFSRLNSQASKVGHDYTSFIILSFYTPFRSKGDFKDLTISNLVVNVSADDKAQILYGAFMHLGELCAAPKGP
jgi:hypothetical protein